MTIDFYYSKLSPPSRAVWMAIKQLGLTADFKSVELSKGEQMKPDYIKLNPSHTVPTIVDDGNSVWESRAILQYLANKYAAGSDLYPTDPIKRSVVDRILFFDTTFFNSLRDIHLIPLFRGTEPTEQQKSNFQNNLKIMDTLIGDNKYVAGDKLTIADLSVLSTSTVFELQDLKQMEGFPNLKSWYNRLKKELPYFDEVHGGVKELFLDMIEKNFKK